MRRRLGKYINHDEEDNTIVIYDYDYDFCKILYT